MDKCPNGCGELEVASGHIYTNNGDTYFNVTVIYCPECKFIDGCDADL